jgi:hypothetical protein
MDKKNSTRGCCPLYTQYWYIKNALSLKDRFVLGVAIPGRKKQYLFYLSPNLFYNKDTVHATCTYIYMYVDLQHGAKMLRGMAGAGINQNMACSGEKRAGR